MNEILSACCQAQTMSDGGDKLVCWECCKECEMYQENKKENYGTRN